MTSPAPLLSACIIARNEAQRIRPCLESLKTVAPEIILVDTGSTDPTPTIAAEAGARVLHHPWQGDFSAARNTALAHASGRYILCLDADETLSPHSAQTLPALLSEALAQNPARPPAFTCLLRDLDSQGRPGMLAEVLRLFPNLPGIRFQGAVHEQIAPALQRAGIPILPSPILLLHTGYASPEARRHKQQRNLELFEREAEALRRIGLTPAPEALFHAAGACADLGHHTRACALYRQCLSALPPAHPWAAAAQVRLATSLAALEDWSAIRTLTPPGHPATWHPELLAERGWAELKASPPRPEKARAFLELALTAPDTPRLPPCHLIATQSRAALALAEYWATHAGRQPLALDLMRAVLSAAHQGQPLSKNTLTTLYAAHHACLSTEIPA